MGSGSSPVLSVYPRWRGEHIWQESRQRLAPGLSPLARGTLFENGPHTDLTRFIPAGAGNTALQFVESGELTVYPRWRGEHTDSGIHCRFIHGLSPLARGTPTA